MASNQKWLSGFRICCSLRYFLLENAKQTSWVWSLNVAPMRPVALHSIFPIKNFLFRHAAHGHSWISWREKVANNTAACHGQQFFLRFFPFGFVLSALLAFNQEGVGLPSIHHLEYLSSFWSKKGVHYEIPQFEKTRSGAGIGNGLRILNFPTYHFQPQKGHQRCVACVDQCEFSYCFILMCSRDD